MLLSYEQTNTLRPLFIRPVRTATVLGYLDLYFNCCPLLQCMCSMHSLTLSLQLITDIWILRIFSLKCNKNLNKFKGPLSKKFVYVMCLCLKKIFGQCVSIKKCFCSSNIDINFKNLVPFPNNTFSVLYMLPPALSE